MMNPLRMLVRMFIIGNNDLINIVWFSRGGIAYHEEKKP